MSSKYAEIAIENKRLKAEIEALKRSRRTSSAGKADGDEGSVCEHSIGEQSVDVEFAGLRYRMRKAELAAKKARAHTRALTRRADNWKKTSKGMMVRK